MRLQKSYWGLSLRLRRGRRQQQELHAKLGMSRGMATGRSQSTECDGQCQGGKGADEA